MAHLTALAVLTMLALTGSAAGALKRVQKKDVTYPTVADALIAGNYTALLGALELTGLTDAFGPDFEGTIFAPSDAAFASFTELLTSLGVAASLEDPRIVAEVLKYHVLNTTVKAADFQEGLVVETLAGAPLTIIKKNGGWAVEDVNGRSAKITVPDVAAGKAIIHGINGVLVPIELPASVANLPAPDLLEPVPMPVPPPAPAPKQPSPAPLAPPPSPVPGSNSGSNNNSGSSGSSSSGGSSTGAIVGAVVGVVVVIAGAAFGVYLYRRRRRQPAAPVVQATQAETPKDSLDTFVVMPQGSWDSHGGAGPGTGPTPSTVPPTGPHAATGYASAAAAAAVGATASGAAAAPGVGAAPSPAPAGELASLPPVAEDLADGPMATLPTRPAGGPPMSLASLQADGAAAAGPPVASAAAASQQSLAISGTAAPATPPTASRDKTPGQEPAAAAALLSHDPLLTYLKSQVSMHSATSSGTSQLRSPGSQGGIDVRPFEISWADLTIRQPCGEGSFGKVYLADWFSIQVAAKVLIVGQVGSPGDAQRALTLSAPIMAKLEAEASLLASLRHPHIVNFLGICHEPPCIVTEYCARGSLTQVLATARTDPAVAAELTWRRRLTMAVDAAAGMLYLHTRPPPGGPIVHRDLKGPNLLVDASWTVKVTDFNLSRILLDESTQSSSMAAMNPRWLAPEVMGGGRSEPAADVYAFGIIMHELLTWQVPWGTANSWQLVSHVLAGGRLEVPDRHALPGPDNAAFGGLDAYVALMKECWAQDPAARPSFQQIVVRLRALLDLAP